MRSLLHKFNIRKCLSINTQNNKHQLSLWIGCNSCPPKGMKMQKLSTEELLAQYSEGKRNFNAIDLSGDNLFQADLAEINLSGSILRRAYLPYGNLSQANLYKTELQDAELGDIQLYQANLSEANLSGANLSRANLRHANLRHANLQKANLQGADLYNADFSNADLRYADLSRANLEKAKLTNAQLAGCNLFRSRLVDLSDANCDRTTIGPEGYR